MNFAFISRHQPTAEQIALAAEKGINITAIGDADAFSITPSFVNIAGVKLDIIFEGVIVVHPAAAMRLRSSFIIGIFENGTRASIDGKPTFFAKSLSIYDQRNLGEYDDKYNCN